MIFTNSISTFGEYLILMHRVFARPQSMRMFFRQFLREIYKLGVNSIPIVLLISICIGAVICIQMKLLKL